MFSRIKKFNPSVDKRFLVALSGILWSVVGTMLCRLAVRWLSLEGGLHAVRLGLAGAILALLIYYFGFLKLVRRNTERILSKKEKICIFAFQPWKSYIIIAVMIGLGVILRSSSLPKQYLSVIYMGFGGAMVLSSLVYYRNFFRKT
ncbi:MAG: hypothetical protein C4526_01365 [Nitrospiraceae bacterium]|nr:MAG: hypothetical protein C4526_01365 [Nitrospiraceae bacterium]